MASKSKKSVAPADAGAAGRRVLRLGLAMIFAGVLALGWVACLSHHPADAPGTTIWPAVEPVRNYAGRVGATVSHFALTWLGSGTYMGLLFGSVAVALVLMGGRLRDPLLRAVGLALLIASTSTGVWLVQSRPQSGTLLGGAGWLGAGCGMILQRHFGDFSWMIVLVALLVGLILAADELVVRLPGVGRGVWGQRKHLGQVTEAFRAVAGGTDVGPRTVTASPRPAVAGKIEPPRPSKPRVSIAQVPPIMDKPSPAGAVAGAGKPAGKYAADNSPAQGGRAGKDSPAGRTFDAAGRASLRDRLKALVHSAPPGAASPVADVAAAPAEKPKDAPRPRAALSALARKSAASASAVGPVDGLYGLPSAELLIDPEPGYIESQEVQVELKRAILQQTLNDFNVEAQVVGHMTGPVITLFELSVAPGVKVSQIANLSNDIARALAAPGVRIVSPIPGKDTIGIEVPNARKEIVRIKQLMHDASDAPGRMHLPLFLGKDAGGEPIVADLGIMPHMLMAGTTGSGKSVCINTIIMSLLLTRRPQDVRLILVDPKMVEMAAFESIPHLLCPIVNDMRKAEAILEWAATKMDERYELLKEAGVKNVAQFNRLGPEKVYKRLGVESEQEKAQVQTRMPYYVIIIDELADLIMTSSKEVEGYIIRIAQKARAVGIHLILATQRPSVNVVTGLIKSNMPCRVSFRVASRQESRIVLDQNGAEVLLGQGDMLFLQPGTSNLVRAQGTFLDDAEIHRVVEYLVGQARQDFNPELVAIRPAGLDEDGEGGAPGERDELFDRAVEIVLQTQRGSVSLLQRRLSVGYSRASRIVDQMAEAGILGDFKGSQARQCMMTLEDWQALKASIAADEAGDSALNGEPTTV